MSSEYIFKGEHNVLEGDSIPKALKSIPRPPEKLFVIGDCSALVEGLAIVGARNASPYGLSCAKHFATLAAKSGINIISGGAIGCDSESHKACIEAGGKTVVFLGGGCHKPYPTRNTSLYQRVIDSGGAIVSENDWLFDSKPYTFRERNRLIAGMSKATLVVQAGIPSGTFTTADDAIAAGKEVLAIPGAITYSGSMGCNKLIYQGATPIVDDDVFYDVVLSLFGALRPNGYMSNEKIRVKRGEKVGQSDNPVLEALLSQPMGMEDLYEFAKTKCGSQNPSVWLSKKLVEAEQTGRIAKYSNGKFGPQLK